MSSNGPRQGVEALAESGPGTVPGRRWRGPDSRQRLRYRFDNLLARGTWATLIWLGVVTLIVVAVSAFALAIFNVGLSGSEDASYIEDFWQSLLRVLDPGTMAGDVGWGRRVLALIITVFGLLVAGTLIGVIAAGVEDRIERMRRGRSVVFESGHVVVLGASDRLPLLIRQLDLARSHLRDSVIVVMADRDPAELQDSVRRVMTGQHRSRLVFRSGDPTHLSDLEVVRVQEAEVVIVLADEEAGDSRAIRTVMAVRVKLAEHDSVPVVVELSDEALAQRLIQAHVKDVHPISPAQAVRRIASVALREPGAGRVAMSLLDDRESDIHIVRVPSLEGSRFFDVLQAYTSARPIGIIRANGAAEINPPAESVIEPGDRLVLISDTPEPPLATTRPTNPTELPPAPPETGKLNLEPTEQRILVWGWSDLGASLLADWVKVAAPSSSFEILVDREHFDALQSSVVGERDRAVSVAVAEDQGDLAKRLGESPPIDTIVLCTSRAEGENEEEADSRTLLTLAGVRHVLDAVQEPSPRLVVELLDADNIPLADMRGPDDFVVSDALASQLIVQLAEQPDRRRALLELYEPSGASIRLVPVGRLGLSGVTSASEIYRIAYAAGLLAIGWRRPQPGGGELVLNPDPSQTADLAEGDQIVVIG